MSPDAQAGDARRRGARTSCGLRLMMGLVLMWAALGLLKRHLVQGQRWPPPVGKVRLGMSQEEVGRVMHCSPIHTQSWGEGVVRARPDESARLPSGNQALYASGLSVAHQVGRDTYVCYPPLAQWLAGTSNGEPRPKRRCWTGAVTFRDSRVARVSVGGPSSSVTARAELTTIPSIRRSEAEYRVAQMRGRRPGVALSLRG